MEGFINVLKPPGMTSHDVVAWLRKVLRVKKIGHAGTLDPNAAGVLPVAVGRGTRLLEYLLDSSKSYRCELVLGVETDTQDLDGKIVARNQVSRQQLEQFPVVLKEFQGEIMQVPPMVSAVRVKGQRLYELARRGVNVERSPRRVVISKISLLKTSFSSPPYTALLDVDCSKGTYIRTLCHDLGQRLGCGASLSFLLRTRAAGFQLNGSWTLEGIQENWDKGKKDFFCSLTEILPFPVVAVAENLATALRQGKQIPLSVTRYEQTLTEPGQLVQIVDEEGLVAIAETVLRKQEPFLQPRKVLT